jgi:hypothetical protein
MPINSVRVYKTLLEFKINLEKYLWFLQWFPQIKIIKWNIEEFIIIWKYSVNTKYLTIGEV